MPHEPSSRSSTFLLNIRQNVMTARTIKGAQDTVPLISCHTETNCNQIWQDSFLLNSSAFKQTSTLERMPRQAFKTVHAHVHT
jgi:hypothetical protein